MVLLVQLLRQFLTHGQTVFERRPGFALVGNQVGLVSGYQQKLFDVEVMSVSECKTVQNDLLVAFVNWVSRQPKNQRISHFSHVHHRLLAGRAYDLC